MKSLRLSSCALLLFSVATTATYLNAQDSSSAVVAPFVPEFRIGVSGGLTYNFHGTDFHIIDPAGRPVAEPLDPTPGISIGLAAEYVFSEEFGLVAHLLYSTRPGTREFVFPNTETLLPNPDPNGVPTVISSSARGIAEVAYNLVECDVMLTSELLRAEWAGFGVAAGGSLASVCLITESYRQELSSEENVRFFNPNGYRAEEDGRVLVLARDHPVTDAASTRVSLRGGVYADLGFFEPFHITPGIYYDYGLTRPVSDTDWSLNSFLFLLNVTREL